MSICLPEDLMAEVSGFIETRMALHFPPERWKELEHKIESLAKEFGFTDHEAFCRWLLTAAINTEQSEILASHLTISETYFWREPRVFEALEQKILPELIRLREKGEKRIRIWSAGCATGEEPYSLAIAIKRAIPAIKDWNISILATDINPRILRKAAVGIYGGWSFRDSPLWLKEKFFKCLENGKFEISSEIQKMVTFAYLNLAEDTYPSPVNNTNAMDIIFCRNVLMYFTHDRIQKIGEKLFKSLVSEGWLMVSASELSLYLFPQFTSVYFPDAIVYRKTDEFFTPSPLAHVEIEAQLPLPPMLPEFFTPINKQPEEPAEIAAIGEVVEEEAPEKRALEEEEILETSHTCAGSVRILANQGNLREALIICEKALRENKLDPQLYFLQATILQEQNRGLEAIASLKRALYLDPDFIMGHFALGNLLLHQGKKQIARKHFENALVILAKFHQNEILLESEGLTAGRLREIVFATIQAGELT